MKAFLFRGDEIGALPLISSLPSASGVISIFDEGKIKGRGLSFMGRDSG